MASVRLLEAIRAFPMAAVNDLRIITSNGAVETSCLLMAAGSNMMRSALADAFDTAATDDGLVVALCPDLSKDDVETLIEALLARMDSPVHLDGRWRRAVDCFYVELPGAHQDGAEHSNSLVVESSEKIKLNPAPRQKKVTAYPCNECDTVLASPYSLKVHSSVMHSKEKPHSCSVCSKAFAQKSHLTEHVRMHSGKKNWLCSTCGKKFTSPQNLKKHLQRHEREGEKDLNEQENRNPSRQKTRQERARPGFAVFLCVHCSKQLPSRSSLEKHILSHTGEKPHACHACHKRFRQTSHLNHHIRTVHEKVERPRSHICNECGKGFKSWIELEKHALTHSEERPFRCQVCQKGFIQRIHLQTHMMKHNGERPFLCGQCGKSYVTKAHLKSHVSRTHGGERKYHSCPECDKQFANQADLNVHRRRHTGDAPFQCGVCERGFRAMRLLRNHARRHTLEKPFRCGNCHKTFATSGSLNAHFRRNDTCRLTATKGAFTARRDDHNMIEVAVFSDRATGFDALISGAAAAPPDLLVPEDPILMPTPEEGHGTDVPPAEGASVDTHLKFELPPPTDP